MVNTEKIPKGWKKVKLGDIICSNKESIDKDYPHRNIIYLDTGSITRGKIEMLQEYKLSDAPSRAKRLVKHNDIIYSTVRPIQRHYGIINNPPENFVVSTGFSVIETKDDEAEPLFIYYFLTSDEIVEILDIIAEASTSAYPSLKPSDVERLNILLPPLPEQKAIASVLSSLDDKIDLLHRQNKTLEAIAETLFKQNFIKPSPNLSQRERNGSGEAKEEWEEGKISDLINILSGFAFKSSDFVKNGKYRLITIKNVQNGYLDLTRTNCLSDLPKKMPEYCLLRYGDILLSLTGNVGRCCLVHEKELLLNQRVAKLQPKNARDWAFTYIFFHQKSTRMLLEDMAKGTAQANLSPVETSNAKIRIPPIELLIKYDKEATPLLKKVLENKQQIRTLEKLRDTLLPKLMSGKVRVKKDSR